MRRATSVTQSLVLWPVDRQHSPLNAVLYYTVDDPYAVRLVFVRRDGRETVSYMFGRALLIDGLESLAGDGDVVIGPHEESGWIVVTLCPEDGYPFVLYGARKVLATFVDRTRRLLPLGRENDHLDLDGLIARLLGEVAS